jgi:peptidoglycan/LPS O-acetylase OafA/YrhL
VRARDGHQTSPGRHPCGRLAEYSYTLYLVHYPLLLLAFGLLHPWLHGLGILPSAVAAAATVLVLPIARAIAALFEDRDRFGRLLDSATAILRA